MVGREIVPTGLAVATTVPAIVLAGVVTTRSIAWAAAVPIAPSAITALTHRAVVSGARWRAHLVVSFGHYHATCAALKGPSSRGRAAIASPRQRVEGGTLH